VRALIIIVLIALPFACAGQRTGDVAVATNAPPTGKAYQAGLSLLKEAEAAKPPETRAAKYREALEQFDATSRKRPDSYLAQVTAAYCVGQLAELTAEPAAHQELVQDALRRYESAAKSPKVEARLYGPWAGLLIDESNRESDPARRREMLEKAIQLLAAGLQITDSKGDRARLQYQMGRAQLFQAQVIVERAGRRALYQGALAHFQAAAEVDTLAKQPQLYASWGIALLELSRLRNDPMLLRQATERLSTALQKNPQNQTVRYNLVCAYALLKQTEQAMRHLRTCLDNDDAQHTYFNAAAQDPDLDSLRVTPEFNAIFTNAPANRPVSPFERPVFSDR